MSHSAKYCDHCLPQKVRQHLTSRIGYYLDKINLSLKIPQINLLPKFTDKSWFVLMNLFKMLGIARFESKIDENQLQNRHQIFFKEARNRGLIICAIKLFGIYTADFIFYYQDKKYLYESNPIFCLKNNPTTAMDDKSVVKKILKSHNVPVAEGKIFISRAKAAEYARVIGFPLVVKPRSGSLSVHVTTNISSSEELDEAITIAKQYSKDFIVERFVEGRLYRATVVGKKHLFVCERDAPNVLGDGDQTINELVIKKNLLENRQDGKNVTLHKIFIDEDFLRSKGYSSESIPKNGQKIYVSKKAVLSAGCDVINCSDKVNINNKNLFLNIATIINDNLVGIDFICKDISMSYTDQESAILELNSLPYIDMHENPSIGQKIPVSKIIWDFVLEEIKTQKR